MQTVVECGCGHVQVVADKVGRLKSCCVKEKRRSSVVDGSEAAGKAGQAAKLSEAAMRHGTRRQTWMGPAWMGTSNENDVVSTFDF